MEIPEAYEDLMTWVKDKEKAQEQAVVEVKTISGELSPLLEEEQKLRAQFNEINRKRRELEAKRDEAKRKAREDEAALIRAKRQLQTFQSEKAIEERLKQEAAEFDKITQHYQWREFAFNHQLDGARRLASAKRGILGDKRGLGKSLTSLIWADMVGAKKVLVFAPKDVLHNFKREIEHWTPHRHVAVLGGMPKGQRGFFLKLMASQDQWLLLCNYEAWRRDLELLELLKDLKADAVIIDEAHNIKEKKTSAYQGIRDIIYANNQCNVCGGGIEYFTHQITGTRRQRCKSCLAEAKEFGDFCSVKYVLPMTGTAILNKPQDMWTLLHLVDRVLFPSENAFLQDYCETDPWSGRWKFKSGGEQRLVKRLSSRYVKRDKNSAGVQFKKQQHVEHRIEFDKALYPEQWRVMQEIKNFGAIKMAENVKLDIIGILPDILRRRQAITWPAGIKIWEYAEDQYGVMKKTGRVLYEAPVTESIKMDKCMELAKEIILEEEDRLVIFSQFKEALKELERRFNALGISVIRYDGDASDAKAQEAQLDFDGKIAANHPAGTECNPECKNWEKYKRTEMDKATNIAPTCPGYRYQVIVAHYKKGGVGLNLNAARQMIQLDREWNYGKEDQAHGRIDRLDNLHDTIVHTIHVENTIDNFMDQLIDEKRNMAEGFDSTHDMLERMVAALRDGDLM